jgi:hypothetical protein
MIDAYGPRYLAFGIRTRSKPKIADENAPFVVLYHDDLRLFLLFRVRRGLFRRISPASEYPASDDFEVIRGLQRSVEQVRLTDLRAIESERYLFSERHWIHRQVARGPGGVDAQWAFG